MIISIIMKLRYDQLAAFNECLICSQTFYRGGGQIMCPLKLFLYLLGGEVSVRNVKN